MFRYLALLTLLLPSFLNGQSKAEVKVMEIRENRSKKFEAKKNGFNFNNDSLTIKIDFKRIGLIAASKYMFHIESAKDSSGKALNHKGFKADEFRTIDRKYMFSGMKEEEKDPNQLRLELSLDQSSRTATSVDVKGSLLLQIGDQSAAYFKNVQKMVNQELKHKLLTQAGVKIIVGTKSNFGGGSDNELRMDISGKTGAIASMKLVDAKGKDATNGSSTSTFNGKTSKSLYLKNGVKDVMLKVMIISNMKEVKVPFNLQKIELP